MKKFFLALCFLSSLTSTVFARDNTLDLLNLKVKKILSPFQNRLTTTKLHFNALELGEERTDKVALKALYSKNGSRNQFKFNVDNLSYDYGDGTSPTTVFKGSVGFDFTVFLSTAEINQMIPQAMELLESIVRTYAAQYNDAILIKGVVTSTTQDNQDNYTGLTAIISAQIDLNKLPEEIAREDVIMTDVVVSVNLNVKKGIALEGFVVSNPAYWQFNDEYAGLKELFKDILSGDEYTIKLIQDSLEVFDSLIASIVEIDNTSLWSLLAGNPVFNSINTAQTRS